MRFNIAPSHRAQVLSMSVTLADQKLDQWIIKLANYLFYCIVYYINWILRSELRISIGFIFKRGRHNKYYVCIFSLEEENKMKYEMSYLFCLYAFCNSCDDAHVSMDWIQNGYWCYSAIMYTSSIRALSKWRRSTTHMNWKCLSNKSSLFSYINFSLQTNSLWSFFVRVNLNAQCRAGRCWTATVDRSVNTDGT